MQISPDEDGARRQRFKSGRMAKRKLNDTHILVPEDDAHGWSRQWVRKPRVMSTRPQLFRTKGADLVLIGEGGCRCL